MRCRVRGRQSVHREMLPPINTNVMPSKTGFDESALYMGRIAALEIIPRIKFHCCIDFINEDHDGTCHMTCVYLMLAEMDKCLEYTYRSN